MSIPKVPNELVKISSPFLPSRRWSYAFYFHFRFLQRLRSNLIYSKLSSFVTYTPIRCSLLVMRTRDPRLGWSKCRPVHTHTHTHTHTLSLSLSLDWFSLLYLMRLHLISTGWQRKRWRGAINYGLTAFYSIMANCSNKPEVTRCLQSLQANEMIMAHNRFQDQCKWDTRQSLLTRFNV